MWLLMVSRRGHKLTGIYYININEIRMYSRRVRNARQIRYFLPKHMEYNSIEIILQRMFGLRQMENAGAVLTTSECAILGLLGGADHPKFREVQKIILELAPDTGLLQCPL